MNKEELKARVCEVIRRRNPDIVRLGHAIFAEPELGFKEQKTSAKVRTAFDALCLGLHEPSANTIHTAAPNNQILFILFSSYN